MDGRLDWDTTFSVGHWHRQPDRTFTGGGGGLSCLNLDDLVASAIYTLNREGYVITGDLRTSGQQHDPSDFAETGHSFTTDYRWGSLARSGAYQQLIDICTK